MIGKFPASKDVLANLGVAKIGVFTTCKGVM
jgi:hypothetical protein